MTATPNLNPKNQTNAEDSSTAFTPKPPQKFKPPRFEHPSVLQQSNFWSRAMLWTLLVGSSIAMVWACTAQIKEAIPATGKLEPQARSRMFKCL